MVDGLASKVGKKVGAQGAEALAGSLGKGLATYLQQDLCNARLMEQILEMLARVAQVANVRQVQVVHYERDQFVGQFGQRHYTDKTFRRSCCTPLRKYCHRCQEQGRIGQIDEEQSRQDNRLQGGCNLEAPRTMRLCSAGEAMGCVRVRVWCQRRRDCGVWTYMCRFCYRRTRLRLGVVFG